MTPDDIIIVVLGDEQRIVDAVTAGAGWEIWMQVEFVLLARARDWRVAREIPYPNGGYILDFLLGDWQQRYAVELKVESATNAGKAVLKGFLADVEKLRVYHTDELAGRYALGIAYSDEANKAMEAYAGDDLNRVYKRVKYIGVLVESVPPT